MRARPFVLLLLAFAASAPARARHAAPPSAPLRAGDYVCEAAQAGMFPLTILPHMRYRAAGPPGWWHADGGLIRFEGGSLNGQVGRLLSPLSFSLATDARTPAYTRCARAAATRR